MLLLKGDIGFDQDSNSEHEALDIAEPEPLSLSPVVRPTTGDHAEGPAASPSADVFGENSLL